MVYACIVGVVLIITIGILLLLTNPKNIPIRWLSATLFCTIFMGLNAIITEIIVPSIKIDNGIISSLLLLAGFFNTIGVYFFPYLFLMFSLFYTEEFFKKWQNIKIKVLYMALIPIILMYICFPIRDFTSLYSYKISHTIVALWVTPYLIFSNILLLYVYFNIKNPKLKNEVFNVNIFVVPSSIAFLTLNYIPVGFGISFLFKYEVIAMFFSFIMFLFFITKKGILGIRLRFEKYRLDSALQMFTSGTSVINHAIKNEIMNISLGAKLLEKSPLIIKNESLNETVCTINSSTQNIISLVTRLNEQMKEIVLNESPNNLIDLIDQSLTHLNAYLSSKNIQVTKDYAIDSSNLFCDPLHTGEVINNIIKNAVEAMDKDGRLEIQIYQNGKRFVMAVKDNGVGIPKEILSRVMEPFFSTKNQQLNFGLGLSYCYNVMQKHGGSLEIHSEENVGTTVFLLF